MDKNDDENCLHKRSIPIRLARWPEGSQKVRPYGVKRQSALQYDNLFDLHIDTGWIGDWPLMLRTLTESKKRESCHEHHVRAVDGISAPVTRAAVSAAPCLISLSVIRQCPEVGCYTPLARRLRWPQLMRRPRRSRWADQERASGRG